jgi:hypothetical protein
MVDCTQFQRLEYSITSPVVLQSTRMLCLQSILEQLVHLGHLGRHGQIDSAVANLDNQAAADLGVDLGHDLELLAVGDVVGLVDGGLEAADGSVVEGLSIVSLVLPLCYVGILESIAPHSGRLE